MQGGKAEDRGRPGSERHTALPLESLCAEVKRKA